MVFSRVLFIFGLNVIKCLFNEIDVKYNILGFDK